MVAAVREACVPANVRPRRGHVRVQPRDEEARDGGARRRQRRGRQRLRRGDHVLQGRGRHHDR